MTLPRSKRDQKSYDERMAAIKAPGAVTAEPTSEEDLGRMRLHIESIKRGGAFYEELRALVEKGEGAHIDREAARDLVAYLDSL